MKIGLLIIAMMILEVEALGDDAVVKEVIDGIVNKIVNAESDTIYITDSDDAMDMEDGTTDSDGKTDLNNSTTPDSAADLSPIGGLRFTLWTLSFTV